ncbi:DUF6230 family protein [Streptomyces sp. NL15-2K]|uniref:DUF6230 family protein n=1 Tax=Streptomyces sp. NL15-2K TaxID=376149 RepID=UPI000F580801|nr:MULTISPECIES: DUF6230 family protein [Actinomycetes]WKX15956.1 DUF6230 family protein [Kutzneria buriramensis]
MRFWLLMGPASVAAGGVLAGTATGALAASVAASGEAFKVSADRLTGSGFTALPGMNVDPKTGARHPVVVVTAREAELSDLCVSVLVKTPVGPVTVLIGAGTEEPVKASGLVVDSDQLHGDIHFGDVLARAEGGSSGGFMAQTARVTVHHPRFTGWQGTAGSFHLSGLSMRVKPGDHECF